MSEAVQVLLLVIGALLSILVTLLLNQITGIRSDLKQALNELKEMDRRLVKLETEHSGAVCQFRGRMDD
jgi:hypothetical protein